MTREEAIKTLYEYRHCFWDKLYEPICMAIKALEQEPKTGWNNHQIACMLADLFGDACACNYNDIDEWLPVLCDFKDTCCPNPVGVACWEQFLKYSQSRYTECGYEVRDKNALQEPSGDLISRQAVLDLAKKGVLVSNRNYESVCKAINELPSVNPQEPKAGQFAEWVATEIFDENWEYNKDAFEELACRKLAKLGIVRAKGDEWELVEQEEEGDKK